MAAGDKQASSGNSSPEVSDKTEAVESAENAAKTTPSDSATSASSTDDTLTVGSSELPNVPVDADTAPQRSSTTLGIVLLVLMLGVLANGAIAYVLWQSRATQEQAINRLQDGSEQVAVLEGRLDETAAGARELQAQVARETQGSRQQLSTLQSQQKALKEALTLLEQSDQKLREKVEGGAQAWRLDAVEQLLMMANERLLLAQDARSAEQALKLADQRLNALADPAWIEVRQALASEMAALRAIPTVDATAISLKLRALADRVPGLPLIGHIASTDGDPLSLGTEPANTEVLEWYEMAWFKVRDAVLSLVTIRRNTTPTSPLLPPDLHGLLIQNLRLQFESARTAMLLRDAGMYRAALTAAADWTQEYLAIDDPAVQATLQTLDELRRQDIAPAVPDISSSLRLLRQIRAAD